MFILDWRLASGLAPGLVFMLLTKRVGDERKRITTTKQETVADMDGVAVRVRDPARQDDGPVARAGRPFHCAPQRLSELEVSDAWPAVE